MTETETHVQQSEADQDHQDLLASVRQAVATERAEQPESEQPEAEQIGADIAAQLTAQEQQRASGEDKPAQRRNARGQFASAEPDRPMPPTSWSQQARDEFAKLSPAVQEAVLKRESEINNGFQQYSDGRQRLQEIDQIMGPRREMLAQLGYRSDAEAINQLVNLSEAWRTDPLNTTLHVVNNSHLSQQQRMQLGASILQSAGVDVRQLGQGGVNPQQIERLKQQWIAESLPQVQRWAAEQIQAALTQDRQQRQRTEQKVRASNASLNGAPHGASSGNGVRRTGVGQFGSIQDDVREAIAALR